MITRIWRGFTRPEHFDEYAEYIEQTGLRGLAAAEGNLGFLLWRRLHDDRAEFVVQSLWESIEAIKGFAGEDAERARYYPRDTDYLLELEPTVEHYEVSASKHVGAPAVSA
jgi:heme-degrading monooxygenase HmoA